MKTSKRLCHNLMEALKEEDEENKESTFEIIDNDDTIQPSNITIDNVIMDSGRKEMLLNSINNFITFWYSKSNFSCSQIKCRF